MNRTDLSASIAAIKAECEEILRLSEKATAGPWSVSTNNTTDPGGQPLFPGVRDSKGELLLDVFGFSDTVKADASFIAASRNVSPAMARVVVGAINRWEVLAPVWSTGSGLCAQLALEEIANQWEGKP
jgi:hypothetical protein